MILYILVILGAIAAVAYCRRCARIDRAAGYTPGSYQARYLRREES